MCPSNVDVEDTEHFLLLCHSCDGQWQDLLVSIVESLWPFVLITDCSNDAVTQLLVYSGQELTYSLNKNILESTLHFIHDTGHFE